MLKKYTDMKIAAKLIIGFVIVALIAGIIGVVGLVNIKKIGDDSRRLYEKNTLGLNYAASAEVNYQRIRFNVVKELSAAGSSTRDESFNRISDYIKKTEDNLALYKGTLSSEEELRLYEELIPQWNTFLSLVAETGDMMRSGMTGGAKDLVFGDLQTSTDACQATFDKIFENDTSDAEKTALSNAQVVQTSMLLMIGIAAAGVIIAIILGIAISRLIGNPLKEMAVNARKLALGDVNIEMKVNSKDEVGELANALEAVVAGRKRQVQETHQLADGDLTVDIHITSEQDVLGKSLSNLVESLNEVVVSIMSSAEQVASGASLVSDSSMALSQGATMQASSVEQLTASLQEIASQTTISTKNAQSANELARLAKKDAEDGNDQMKGMLAAMEAINISSGSIGKIIKVIDDIAFQTNILALNAAVEAARAGQHGKGFAVVAEEVRTLAARSAQAAKETTNLIEGSIKKVEAGTKIATDTASALNKIVGEVAKAAELVEEIANASNEQASAIAQINQGILQVSQVVQNNAATSEESAAASEELSSQAAQLKETIGIFQVKQAHMTSGFGTSPSKANRTAISAPKSQISLGDDFGKY